MKNIFKNKIASIAASGIIIVVFAISFIFFGDDNDSDANDVKIGNIDVEVGDIEVGDVDVEVGDIDVEVEDVEVGDVEVGDIVPNEYFTFRNEEYLDEHYEKHGIEMGFESAEEYLDAANAVIDNQASLYKLEAEDGDGVYYLETTNEFVVLSKDGYIRTYFYPSDGIEYFNRQ